MRNATLAAAAALVLLASAARADDAPWIVDDPHCPTEEVRFTTDEATWIHLDLSPDGKTIVFSVLGDLYLLPAEGGTARRITSGPSMDVQPRFSPDGKRVAFASDRGGLENLWTCDLDGKELTQVSTEKASTVSAPAWSPDGQWLLGRKRLTDVSSLGTVELWMWHVKGGDGVRITKKQEQPDAADPAFSRDGRWIWFAARDARYRYDRNVNEGIWQLKRLDRKTGRVLPATGEFGGAATPLPSPDGKSVAFVRRVRAKTRIELLDLATGRTRLVADDVQRDNQEGFAFHGVFPGYAWTPDGRSIVATAEGKIFRYDVASGSRTPIPFTAAVEQKLAEAVRSPRRVAEGDVTARIIRWPVETPDGKTLVFSALGHLYSMELPSGTPKRLTSSEELEYAPAFSRDGHWLFFNSDRPGGAGGTDMWVSWRPNIHDDFGWETPVNLSALNTLSGESVGSYFENDDMRPMVRFDGREIVLASSRAGSFGGRDLWVSVRETVFDLWPRPENLGPIVNTGANELTPYLSGDGLALYFGSDRAVAGASGLVDLYVTHRHRR